MSNQIIESTWMRNGHASKCVKITVPQVGPSKGLCPGSEFAHRVSSSRQERNHSSRNGKEAELRFRRSFITKHPTGPTVWVPKKFCSPVPTLKCILQDCSSRLIERNGQAPFCCRHCKCEPMPQSSNLLRPPSRKFPLSCHLNHAQALR